MARGIIADYSVLAGNAKLHARSLYEHMKSTIKLSLFSGPFSQKYIRRQIKLPYGDLSVVILRNHL